MDPYQPERPPISDAWPSEKSAPSHSIKPWHLRDIQTCAQAARCHVCMFAICHSACIIGNLQISTGGRGKAQMAFSHGEPESPGTPEQARSSLANLQLYALRCLRQLPTLLAVTHGCCTPVAAPSCSDSVVSVSCIGTCY
jgi:hypothetical protein